MIKTILPEIPEGFVLNNDTSYFSVIIPEESVNLVSNPEMYTLDGYASNRALTLHYEDTHYGLNCIRASNESLTMITYDLNMPLVGHRNYTFSFSAKGTSTIMAFIADDQVEIISEKKEFQINKYWNRYSVTIRNCQGDYTKPYLMLLVTDENIVPDENYIYLSAFQFEEKPYPTTFISGNMKSETNGVDDYLWFGIPHKSISGRTDTVMDGGKIVNFKELGIEVKGFIGLGNPTLDYNIQPSSNSTGSSVISTILESREFNIVGTLMSKSNQDYFQKRNLITKAISNRPLKLLFQYYNCNKPESEVYEIYCRYKSGLEGNYTNLFAEELDIAFTMYDPYIYKSGNKAKQIASSSSLSNAYVYSKNAVGQWSAIGLAQADSTDQTIVNKLKVLTDNNLYYAGQSLQRYDGTSFVTLVTTNNAAAIPTVGSEIYDFIQIGTKIYFCGNFSSISSATNTVSTFNFGMYDLTNDTVYDVGRSNGRIYALELTYNGKILIGGGFTQVTSPSSTITSVNNLIVFNPNTVEFEQITDVASFVLGVNYITTLKMQSYNTIWVGGYRFLGMYNPLRNTMDFYNDTIESRGDVNGLPSNCEADQIVLSIAISKNNEVYVGGFFDSSYETAASELSQPNGYHTLGGVYSIGKLLNNKIQGIGLIAVVPPFTGNSFSKFSTLVNGVGVVRDMTFNDKNELIIVGEFNHINNNPGLYSTGLVPKTFDPITLCNDGSYKPNVFGVCKYVDGLLQPYDTTLSDFEDRTYCNYMAVCTGGTNKSSNINSLNGTSTFLINSPANKKNLYFGITKFISHPVTNSPPEYFDGTGVVVPTTEVLDIETDTLLEPYLQILGLGSPLSIINYNSNSYISFIDKLLMIDEIITIDLKNYKEFIKSSTGMNQSSYIGIGTSFSNFKLRNGKNYISTLWKLESTGVVNMFWREKLLSIDSIFNKYKG